LEDAAEKFPNHASEVTEIDSITRHIKLTTNKLSMSEISFLSLPGEIRNQIYSYLLIAPPLTGPRQIGDFVKLHPSILSVCSKTYHEALEYLYAKNTFIAHYSLLSGLPSLRSYFSPIKSADLISKIKRYHIYVRLDCDAHFTYEDAKKSLSGLEELTVEAHQTQFGSSDHRVLQRFEGVRGVTKATVEGSTIGFPGYQSWLEKVMMSPEDAEIEDFDEELDQNGMYDVWIHGGR